MVNCYRCTWWIIISFHLEILDVDDIQVAPCKVIQESRIRLLIALQSRIQTVESIESKHQRNPESFSLANFLESGIHDRSGIQVVESRIQGVHGYLTWADSGHWKFSSSAPLNCDQNFVPKQIIIRWKLQRMVYNQSPFWMDGLHASKQGILFVKIRPKWCWWRNMKQG